MLTDREKMLLAIMNLMDYNIHEEDVGHDKLTDEEFLSYLLNLRNSLAKSISDEMVLTIYSEVRSFIGSLADLGKYLDNTKYDWLDLTKALNEGKKR